LRKLLLIALIFNTFLFANQPKKEEIKQIKNELSAKQNHELSLNLNKLNNKTSFINKNLEAKSINIFNYSKTKMDSIKIHEDANILFLEIGNLTLNGTEEWLPMINTLNNSLEINSLLLSKLEDYYLTEMIQLSSLSLLFFIIYLLMVDKRKKNIERDLLKNPDFQDAGTLMKFHKIRIRTGLITMFVTSIIFIYLIENIAFFLTTLSLVSAVLVLGIREQLGDILVGVLFHLKFTNGLLKTSFNLGDRIEFYSVPKLKGIYTITSFNFFKTILFNESYNEFVSIRNTDLIKNEVRHMPLNKLHTFNLKYYLPIFKNTEEINDLILEHMELKLKDEKFKLNFGEIKEQIPSIKNNFGRIPRIRNNISFFYKARNEISLELSINFSVYSIDSKTDLYTIFYQEIHNLFVKNDIFDYTEMNFYLNQEVETTESKKTRHKKRFEESIGLE